MRHIEQTECQSRLPQWKNVDQNEFIIKISRDVITYVLTNACLDLLYHEYFNFLFNWLWSRLESSLCIDRDEIVLSLKQCKIEATLFCIHFWSSRAIQGWNNSQWAPHQLHHNAVAQHKTPSKRQWKCVFIGRDNKLYVYIYKCVRTA